MKLVIDGNVNAYFVQTLCMVFFPGEEYGEAGAKPGAPKMTVTVRECKEFISCRAVLTANGKTVRNIARRNYAPEEPREKTIKFAVGAAVMSVGEQLLGYRPPWGMLTGVRPSKVARAMMESGLRKTATRRVLVDDFNVLPKKAQLALDVAQNEMALLGQPSPLDCSVYISIPFCPSRCAYCSFVSYTTPKLLSLIPAYLKRLTEEIEGTFRKIKQLGLRVKTVYIGGGTPTTLTPDEERILLDCISRSTDVGQLEEFTLEAGRPDTIMREKMEIARSYGVTRVSVNPQSLSPEVLAEIGRKHSVDAFFRAFSDAREAGIPTVNTDLIVGLPGDDFRKFASTIDKVIDLGPENMTVHTFCVKKASDFLKEGTSVYSIRGGDAGKCVDYAQLRTSIAGYRPYYMYRQKNTVGNYENVGFALPGTEGRYNVYMMEEVHSIFACGAGAVSKMVHFRPGGENGEPRIRRVGNPKYPFEYLDDTARLEKNLEAFDAFYREQKMI